MAAAHKTTETAIKIGPQPGSQEEFLSSPADMVFYGGEAGSGKTGGLALEALRNYDIRAFSAIMFRRTSPQLEGPGSLWELMEQWYPALGARLTQNPYKAVFPSGASVRLGHLQHEQDKLAHQGKGYTLINFDELPHFTESQFWYLFSRSRSMSGIRSYVRATMNPDPDSWVKKMILWYLDEQGEFIVPERSGVIRYFYRVGDELEWGDSEAELRARHPEFLDPPTSFTFIRGRLSDNKILHQKDPGYRSRLMALPRVERERLLGDGTRGGNWRIRPAAGLYFQRGWFHVIETLPRDLVVIVRGWDKAASQVTAESPDPDWTRGVKMGVTRAGRFVILHMESVRGSPHQVDTVMRNIAAQDGKAVKIAIWQDPGQAGVVDVMHMKSILMGYRVESVVAREDKVTYAGPFSTQVEAGNVDVLAGPWNDALFSELEGFPDGRHKDIVDACSRAFMALHNAAALAYQAAMNQIKQELTQ